MRKDRYGTENGRIEVLQGNPVIPVSAEIRLTIQYTVGPQGIAVGGCIRFRLPYFNLEQAEEPPVSCSNPETQLQLSHKTQPVNGKPGTEFFLTPYLFVTVMGHTLIRGDTIIVLYHTKQSPAEAKPYALEVAVDADGTRPAPGSGFYLVPKPPQIRFVSRKAAKLVATIPSHTVTGQPFDLTIRARDSNHNFASGYRGTVSVFAEPKPEGTPLLTHTFNREDRGVHRFEDVVLSESGIHRLSILDKELGFQACTNPTRTGQEPPAEQLYWGDTHAHSNISADTSAGNSLVPDPAGVYEYARNLSDLDFCMVTDHSEDLVPEDWTQTQEAAAKFHEPGRFVAFTAYEATHQPLRKDGDRNVYFFGDDDTYVNTGPTTDVFRELKKSKDKVMVIPHQHAKTNWECHDPSLERVVEIYSHWGCGLSPESKPPMVRGGLNPQNYVSHALEQGARIGFIASADHSHGHPGDDFWWSLSEYNGGLAAVYAQELSRKGVWDGLWNRHCYATTRARILLEFEINGHPMGEEFNIASGEKNDRCIKVNAYGTVSIENVEIVKNGRVLHSTQGDKALDMEFGFTDKNPERETDYYYIHTTQVDGEQAWSSPIWVTWQK